MKRYQAILVMTVASSAFWAGRVVEAAPMPGARVAEAAGRLVQRLTLSLHRVIPASRVEPAQRFESARPSVAASAPARVYVPFPHSVFQFRLPPPAV